MSRSREFVAPLVIVVVTIVVLCLLLIPQVQYQDAKNSGFRERTSQRLKEASLEIFDRQENRAEDGCVPVVANDAENGEGPGWHSRREPLSAHEWSRRDRMWNYSSEEWTDILLCPVAVGESLETGCLRLDAIGDEENAVPIVAMVPVSDPDFDRFWLDREPEFGPELRQSVREAVCRAIEAYGLVTVHTLLSNGMVRAIRIEEFDTPGWSWSADYSSRFDTPAD